MFVTDLSQIDVKDAVDFGNTDDKPIKISAVLKGVLRLIHDHREELVSGINRNVRARGVVRRFEDMPESAYDERA